ncbi:hypothetical protein JCM15548_14388 [Geofilum rubicundum JCM 15548]|uniref:Uncharacterized protein n=1 Tax=Geofilum rubicundum JCM 15548 TaxID=1236989 RepID=A0A0E9M3H7_9BACT|nr:hypothetical protein JCM15548_14388 [Geofilum rubicundum JCM 15548]
MFRSSSSRGSIFIHLLVLARIIFSTVKPGKDTTAILVGDINLEYNNQQVSKKTQTATTPITLFDLNIDIFLMK